MHSPSVETFASLNALGFCRHAFIGRVAGVDVKVDRALALERLSRFHEETRRSLGFAPVVNAGQVHGNAVAVVDDRTVGLVPNVDGLITDRLGIALGIYVADCCAVYLADPKRRCIGLLHAGKKGTELGILPEAIGKMRSAFGSNPADLVVQLSPCIRPPFYEIDFASELVAQAREAGVERVRDCGTNTAADVQRYYSYRIELGKTGRMLALLELADVIFPG